MGALRRGGGGGRGYGRALFGGICIQLRRDVLQVAELVALALRAAPLLQLLLRLPAQQRGRRVGSVAVAAAAAAAGVHAV